MERVEWLDEKLQKLKRELDEFGDRLKGIGEKLDELKTSLGV